MEKFKIATEDGLIEAEGEPIIIHGEKCFVHEYDWDTWKVTHAETGMLISRCFNKEETIEDAHKKLKRGKAALKRGREACKKLGYSLPVNPITL